MKNNKVLLAYSGGLDTTYCLKYLQDQDFEVYTVYVNTGGQTDEQLEQIEKSALNLGTKKHLNLNRKNEYYNTILKYLIYGNVLKNGNYPLSVSAERTIQSIALAEQAKKWNVSAISHGSTGAGNDQIRFDSCIQLLAPNMEIITPIRDQNLSREQEVNYLKEKGVSIEWEKAKYSLNKGIWGTSIGGDETLTSHLELPKTAYPSKAENIQPTQLKLSFTKGEVSALNDEKMEALEIIERLNDIGAKYAIAQDIHVGDTIIGIKGRVGFESPAATVIIKAHQLLEKHTLTKWQMYWKDQLSNWYGMFVHEAQFFEPLMRNIEVFMTESQEKVSGDVHLRLTASNIELLGIHSAHDLMQSDFAKYGEENMHWSADDVKGFIKIYSNPMKIYKSVNNTL